ncbi:MAG: hypothetical protein QXP77_00075 [Candidatus Aenigmatarchaeota archaeon]
MAIGIDTLILIVLGIIVLAVMIYLIFSVTQPPVIDCNKCAADFVQYCRICYSSFCSVYKIDNFQKGLCDCLNKCGLTCTEGSTCVDLQNQCAAKGVSYNC